MSFGCSESAVTKKYSVNIAFIRGVSKKFGEWYQKTNKTEDTNKLTLLAFKIRGNSHPSQHTVGNVNKASGNCQQRPL
jgi:hypothetical protein